MLNYDAIVYANETEIIKNILHIVIDALEANELTTIHSIISIMNAGEFLSDNRIVNDTNITALVAIVRELTNSQLIAELAIPAYNAFVAPMFNGLENEVLKELKSFEGRIDKKIEGVSSKVDQKIDALSDKMDKKIECVSNKVDDNERGRLRQEIFNYGNKARKRERIDGEHFRYLQDCYHKYHEELEGNSIAMDEYLFVERYYNSSGWEDKD